MTGPTPEALISSYYNAINRNEYARAFSYFGKDTAPEGYDAWEFGFSEMYWIDVSFGEATEEGAAGSTYYSVPVALKVESTERQHSLYGGCYVIGLVQPANQTPPFEPMHIISAKLSASDGEGEVGSATSGRRAALAPI
jgi:hypothetical protein